VKSSEWSVVAGIGLSRRLLAKTFGVAARRRMIPASARASGFSHCLPAVCGKVLDSRKLSELGVRCVVASLSIAEQIPKPCEGPARTSKVRHQPDKKVSLLTLQGHVRACRIRG